LGVRGHRSWTPSCRHEVRLGRRDDPVALAPPRNRGSVHPIDRNQVLAVSKSCVEVLLGDLQSHFYFERMTILNAKMSSITPIALST
jgi:hypothetical protein